MKKLQARGIWTQFVEPLRKLEAFQTTGSLYGEPGPCIYSSAGQLPQCHVALVREADYVVYSYATPIAWHHPRHGWMQPDENYSQSTTRQQNKIATAISQL